MNVKKTIHDFVEDAVDVTEKFTDAVGGTAKGMANNVSGFIDKTFHSPKDKAYIKEKNEEIITIVNDTDKKIDLIKEETNKKLEELGRTKIQTIETTIDEFSKHINEITHLPFESDVDTEFSNNDLNFFKKELEDTQVSVHSIKEILKNTAVVGVTGVVSAGAAYSAVAAFGAASTGTVMSSISSIVASNATLTWLGGGALAAAGSGMALGAIALGGIAIVPAVSYFLWRGKHDYAQEREAVDSKYKEATEYANSINKIIKNFTELNRLIDNLILLMNRYSVECNKLNKQTDHIKNQIGNDYSKYSDEQKGLIQKNITYISGLLQLINVPVMNKDGSFNNDMISIIDMHNLFLKNANEIEFISYKKRKSTLIYILPALLVVTVILYLYFFLS